MKTNLRLLLLTLAALALGVLAFAELALAMPVAGGLYLAVGLAFVVALKPFSTGRLRAVRGVSLASILAVIVALYVVPWTSRKPFLRDLAKVQVGMSEADVREIMRGYREGTGWPASPFDTATNDGRLSIVGGGGGYATSLSPAGEMALRDALVFRHSDAGAFNSDWGIVVLSAGRVARVEFSAD